MVTGAIDPRYGDATQVPPPWDVVERLLTDAQLYWIVTVRADGRPHAVPLVGVWHAGAFAFCTGTEEQKHRNLEANAQVAVTAGDCGANGWDEGKNVVVEGRAVRVTDPGSLQTLATAWSDKYGDDWRWTVRGDRFVAAEGSGGSRDGAVVYRVETAKVLVFGDEHGQTRYRF
jgi:nitroimidazol reductase NimA-like FMN-containing flavoprotein (pyridoxamine 5'-phosphate oxidase superfamily)